MPLKKITLNAENGGLVYETEIDVEVLPNAIRYEEDIYTIKRVLPGRGGAVYQGVTVYDLASSG